MAKTYLNIGLPEKEYAFLLDIQDRSEYRISMSGLVTQAISLAQCLVENEELKGDTIYDLMKGQKRDVLFKKDS